MRLPWTAAQPRLELGTYGAPFLPRALRSTLSLSRAECFQHGHIVGKSGSGKSSFLAGVVVGLLGMGLPVTLLDPHGDLCRLVLALLIDHGAFSRPEAFDRILYLDLPGAEATHRYLPLNPLAVLGRSDVLAANVKESFHRAFPELGIAAATFDTLLPDVVELLVHNGLPLTELHRVLVSGDLRETLLARETDEDLVSSFRDVYEQFKKADQVQYAGSLLRRARELTRIPILKFGLAQGTTGLDFSRVLLHHQAVLLNLAVQNRDAQRLLGALITVAAEQAALAQGALPPEARRGSMHLVIDEFELFCTDDAKQFTDMLSEARKFNVFLWVSHQSWSQVSPRLRSALQNAGIEVVLLLDREDAEYSAKKIGKVDLAQVKHIVEDTEAEARTHPVFASVVEQWEGWVQSIQEMLPGEAWVAVNQRVNAHGFHLRRTNRKTHKITTMPVVAPQIDSGLLTEIEAEYVHRYFTPESAVREQIRAVRGQFDAARVRPGKTSQ